MLSGDASIGISITWSSASYARISLSIRSVCASDDGLDIHTSMNTRTSPGIFLYIMLLLNSGLSPYAYANAYACACVTSEDWAYSTMYLEDTSLILSSILKVLFHPKQQVCDYAHLSLIPSIFLI